MEDMSVVTGWPDEVVLTATVKGWRAAAEDISRLVTSTTSCTYCRSVSQNMVVYRTWQGWDAEVVLV